MMTTEVLIQVLLIVGIVAVVYLIFVLAKTQQILTDVKSVSGIAAKRAQEIDQRVSSIEGKLDVISESIKSFLLSFEFIKKVKNNFSKEKKGAEDVKE